MTLNIGNRWGPYHEYIPYQKPCGVLLNIICLTESGFDCSLFSILKMGWWFQVIWYSWDELTPPTSDAKKTHPPKQMVCIRICFVCTCMYICAYVDVRRCASIFWNPPHKGRPYGFDMFWQCCKLSRIWQEKYQCGEEYSKHAEVRMSRISLSVCSLQTALMLFETEELEYCHTFCCTPAGLGTLVLEESPAKV